MISLPFRAAFAVALVICIQGAWAQTVERPLTAAPLQPDVRVLIDISGSMKQNDPQNLRRPAVELLVKLLPEDSRAGIWSFGNDAQSLVPHETVTDAWRLLAQDKARSIDSRSLFTNIGAALDAAAGAGVPQKGFRTSLVLLTDGMVDISKDASVNSVEWQRILHELLPRLQEAGFVVHTIALSDNADQELLSKLALGTGGLAAVAKDADELLAAFLKIFDAAAPAEQVSLEDNQFHIDPSIEEFTALIFHDQSSGETRLQNPAGDALGQAEQNAKLSWYEADDYALATVKQPQAGDWQVLADAGPESRVTVVSNLSLRVRELPVNVYRGQSIPLSFALQEDGEVIVRPEFLELMTFKLSLTRQGLSDHGTSEQGEGGPETVWEMEIEGREPPASGIFHTRLPKFEGKGDYHLQLRVDGKSFQREFNHDFSVRMPFQAEVSGAQTETGEPYYDLTLHSNSPDIDPRSTQVVATLITPEDRKLIRPMMLTEQEHWQLRLDPRSTGRYRVNITVNGTDTKGIKFNYVLDELSFYYSPERGFIKEAQGEPPEVVDILEPEREPEPEPEPEAEPKVLQPPTELAPEPAVEPLEQVSLPAAEPEGGLNWPLALSLSLGNLLLVGGGIWLYRKKVSGEKTPDEILDQFSDDKVAAAPMKLSPAPASAAESATGAEEDVTEPEMDALGESATATGSVGNEGLLTEETVDDASLDEALASIMGELDPGDEQDLTDEDFGLSEDDEKRE